MSLREERISAGLSLRQVGEAIGRTPQRVWQIENGIDFQGEVARQIDRVISAKRARDHEAIKNARWHRDRPHQSIQGSPVPH